MSCSSCNSDCCECNTRTGPRGPRGPKGDPGGPAGPTGPAGDDGFGYRAISTSSTDILDTPATTTGIVVMQTNLAYTPGARVRFSESTAPAINFFEGIVKSYDFSTGNMEVDPVDLKEGSGTHALWNVNITGEKGVAVPSDRDDFIATPAQTIFNLSFVLKPTHILFKNGIPLGLLAGYSGVATSVITFTAGLDEFDELIVLQ